MTENSIYSITLLRHGESQGNAEKRVQGQKDFPLTERGLQQARLLAAYWLETGACFDQVISSPLTRARQTAEIITAGLGAPVSLDPAWIERSFGRLEAMRLEEILAQNPGLDFYHPYEKIGQGGESILDLYLRANQAVIDLLRRPPGRYLVVSHGAMLNMVVYAILGLTPQGNRSGPRFPFGNTGYTDLKYDPETRQWLVTGMNQRMHLHNHSAKDGDLKDRIAESPAKAAEDLGIKEEK